MTLLKRIAQGVLLSVLVLPFFPQSHAGLWPFKKRYPRLVLPLERSKAACLRAIHFATDVTQEQIARLRIDYAEGVSNLDAPQADDQTALHFSVPLPRPFGGRALYISCAIYSHGGVETQLVQIDEKNGNLFRYGLGFAAAARGESESELAAVQQWVQELQKEFPTPIEIQWLPLLRILTVRSPLVKGLLDVEARVTSSQLFQEPALDSRVYLVPYAFRPVVQIPTQTEELDLEGMRTFTRGLRKRNQLKTRPTLPKKTD